MTQAAAPQAVPQAAPQPALMPHTPEAGLATLRAEIDRIDAGLHALLMERGAIIDRLIAIKAAQGGGSAFRPAREAAMMRALVERHRGILPLDTVEGIWRIIISTFTYVQAPYTVHADIAGGDAPMRDSCRFHFGFTVPLATHAGPRAVVAAVATAAGDLGLVRADGEGDEASSPWWDALSAPDAPKIIARLPFVERADHAAGLPLYVVAKPLAGVLPQNFPPQDVLLHALTLPGAAARPALPPTVSIVNEAGTGDGRGLVVAAPGTIGVEDLRALFAGAGRPTITFIGSHAARFAATR